MRLAGGLVEREEHLRAIAALVGGRGGMLWIEGEAGLGKTRLLAHAAVAGRPVVSAAGEESLAGEPFGVVGRLLRAALAGPAGAERAAAMFTGAATPAAALLAADAPVGPSLVNAAAWALASLDEPLLLVVDDAHWADPGSLQVLRRLAGWLQDLPLALLVAARPEATGLTGQALDTLRAVAGRPLLLRPLSADGVASVVRSEQYPQADAALVAACAAATDGNPLLLHELLVTLAARGVPADEAGVAAATGLSASLARLPAAATATAEALAVLGADASPKLAAALSDVPAAAAQPVAAAAQPAAAQPVAAAAQPAAAQPAAAAAAQATAAQPTAAVSVSGAIAASAATAPPATAPPATAPPATAPAGAARRAAPAAHSRPAVAGHLAALRSAGIIDPAPSVAFTHAALRAAVLARMAPARVADLHTRAAALLESAGAAPSHVAAHLLAAPPGGHPRAAALLLDAAAEAAALGAPECGAPALRRALEEDLPGRRRASVLLALAAAEAAAGSDTAGERWEAAVELLTDARAKAIALAAAADWHTSRGRPREGVAALLRAEQQTAGDHELTRSLEARRLAISTLDPQLRPTVRPRLEALAARPPTQPTPGERGLLALLAWEHAHTGEPADGVAELARLALDEGRLLQDETADGISLYVAAGALVITDRLKEELETLDAALADARARGSMTAFANASFCRGWPLLALGRVDDAAADFELALGTIRHGWETYVPAARAGLASTLLERSGPGAALAALELEATRARWGTTSMFPSVLIAASAAEQTAGRHDQALARALEAGDRLTELGWTGPSGWRAIAAISAVYLGQTGMAKDLAEEELERARRFGAPRALARALHATARVTGRREPLEEAVEVLAASEARLEHARAIVDLGESHTGSDARRLLREGLDRADRLGARTLATRARSALIAAGGRPRRARLTGPASLTPAERRVAAMAASGQSNRAIAEALWVTTKAVEYHLSRTYAKLSVPGRAELTAALQAE